MIILSGLQAQALGFTKHPEIEYQQTPQDVVGHSTVLSRKVSLIGVQITFSLLMMSRNKCGGERISIKTSCNLIINLAFCQGRRHLFRLL
jgi:hypothetical protein